MSAFDRILKTADKTNYTLNGEPALFAFNDLTQNEDVTVIFEKEKEVVAMQGENQIVVRRPFATIQHQQFIELGLPLPKIRDQLTIQGVIYDIAEAPEDGHNETEMLLEEAN